MHRLARMRPQVFQVVSRCVACVPTRVRRETVWRWTQDPAFAAEVSRRQAERRQAIHSELDAGVLEAVQMLRGLVADPEAQPVPVCGPPRH